MLIIKFYGCTKPPKAVIIASNSLGGISVIKQWNTISVLSSSDSGWFTGHILLHSSTLQTILSFTSLPWVTIIK